MRDDPDHESLPSIDEHERRIDAPVERVWVALGAMLAGSQRRPSRTATVRVLGGRPPRGVGDPLSAGSTIPGFAVARAERPTELVLQGRHRYSRYTLIFRLEPDRGGTNLRAESRAAFPGLTGRLYRRAVIGSGGHVLAVRGMLAAVARRAENNQGPITGE